jgi:hypothetical protein
LRYAACLSRTRGEMGMNNTVGRRYAVLCEGKYR